MLTAVLFFSGWLLFKGTAPEVAVAPPPRPARMAKPWSTYYGEVLAVDAQSVTIRGNEDNDNAPLVVVRFPASRELRRGEQSLWEPSSTNYRLSDLKVGDKVWGMLRQADGETICESIHISRRPGGLVPPAPFEPDDVPYKYHDNTNAYQAHEERGIPLPLHLNREHQRELAKAQEEERRTEMLRRERVAPLPRAALPAQTHPSNYAGEILAVTKHSITIRGKPNGDAGPEITRRFRAGEHLAKGQQQPQHPYGWNYRLSDVKVGDKVFALLRADGDDDLCLTVTIRRRPGGVVPPAPFESADVPNKYHEDMNAYQAFEERGVPLPLRLNEDYQRALNDAIRREVDEARRNRNRIAPSPRPVERR